MSQEEKIKAAYAAAVQRDIYVTNYLSFKTGYLAAIEDIKAKGPDAWINSDGWLYDIKPDDVFVYHPLYRLED